MAMGWVGKMRDHLGWSYGSLALSTDQKKVLGIHGKNILRLKRKGHCTMGCLYYREYLEYSGFY
jgi:hypothetical protein